MVVGMQIHRGQGRVQAGGEELIVAADERHILRYPQPHALQLPQRAQGHQVVDGDHRRGAPLPGQAGEQLGHAQLPRLRGEAGLVAGVRVGVQPQAAHLLIEGGLPDGGGGDAGAAADEGDAPVPQRGQVRDALADADGQIGGDVDARQPLDARADGHQRHGLLQLHQALQRLRAAAAVHDAAHQHRAVQPLLQQPGDQMGVRLALQGGVVQLQHIAAAGSLLQRPLRQRGVIGVGEVGNHQGKGAGRVPVQPPGHGAGVVLQRLDGALHLLPGAGAGAAAGHDPGHGRDGYPCRLRDVIDGWLLLRHMLPASFSLPIPFASIIPAPAPTCKVRGAAGENFVSNSFRLQCRVDGLTF